MKILLLTERRPNIPAKRFFLTAAILWLAGCLYGATFTFKSGATLEGAVVEFKGTNCVVVKSSKDGKPHTIRISELSQASRESLAKQRQMTPWTGDPGWKASERAIHTLREKRAPLARQFKATETRIWAKKQMNENSDVEQKQLADLEKELQKLDNEIQKYKAQQSQIIAGFRLREAGKSP